MSGQNMGLAYAMVLGWLAHGMLGATSILVLLAVAVLCLLLDQRTA
jgi:hypothetical protein